MRKIKQRINNEFKLFNQSKYFKITNSLDYYKLLDIKLSKIKTFNFILLFLILIILLKVYIY